METVKNILDGLKAFLSNPVGDLPALYETLGKRRSTVVGTAFAIFYTICLIFILNQGYFILDEVDNPIS